MKTIESKTTIQVETSLVEKPVTITERLLFGLAPDKDWKLGEHVLIDLLRSEGHITKAKMKDDEGKEHDVEGVDVYSEEAQALVDVARTFFGVPRSLGSAGRREYPNGELTMTLLPAALFAKASAPTTDRAPAGADG